MESNDNVPRQTYIPWSVRHSRRSRTSIQRGSLVLLRRGCLSQHHRMIEYDDLFRLYQEWTKADGNPIPTWDISFYDLRQLLHNICMHSKEGDPLEKEETAMYVGFIIGYKTRL